MTYAIFTKKGDPRRMHAVRDGETQTVCGLPIGIGTGLVRDGDYGRPNVTCATCWEKTTI